MSWLYGIVTHCDGERLAVLLFTVGTKMIDAFSDVFEGQLQKEHRLDLAGISMSTRMLISTGGMPCSINYNKKADCSLYVHVSWSSTLYAVV